MSIRTLKIYFESNMNLQFEILVNDIRARVFKNFFVFDTDTSFHGVYNIVIKVHYGKLKLTRCTATYPAIVNGKEGDVTMVQPIKSPIAVVKDNRIETYGFPITITNHFSYKHLMFNGPTYFVVDTLSEGTSVYIGDLLERLDESVINLETVYEYNKKPNDIFSQKDMEILKESLCNTIF